LKIYSNKLFRPSTLALLAVFFSFIAWIFPNFGFLIKGYDRASEIDLLSIVVLSDWYALLFFGLWIGELAGRTVIPRATWMVRAPSIQDPIIFLVFTLLAATGLMVTYIKIFATMTPLDAYLYVSSGFGNELKGSLYEEYSAGVVSLRYLIVFSASLALDRLLRHRRVELLVLVNFVLLALAALLSSRLIFVATVLSSVFLAASRVDFIKLRIGRALLAVGVIFVILSVLNSSRNSNYYETDDLYFWGAGLSSILTYLGSPFQVAIAVAQHLPEVASEGAEAYRKYADIDITLNTNSAFVQLHEEMGFLAWLYLPLCATFVGLLFGYLRALGQTAFLLPCAALLYGSAEFWRLDLFRQGIFLVWLFAGITVPIALMLLRKVSFRRRVTNLVTPSGVFK
jgi:hypothetical protein